MLALMPCLRQAKANVKAAALKLLSALISAMVSMAGECLRFHATIFGSDWQYHSKEIVFTHGATDGLGDLFSHHNRAVDVWQQLAKRSWNGVQVFGSLN